MVLYVCFEVEKFSKDEGGKIRTIYDGSFGGANSHIQQNTSEKTTAPTVMDCMHGIHWIHASASLAPGDHTAVLRGKERLPVALTPDPRGEAHGPGRVRIQPCSF